ncbi:hypothetical protein CANMA_004076 [Candida margitis]|uniref:uncharacterized protein n=1 Tax=Candida margitis TaxID=1775924 RepID=UPI00222777B5|nr:uncharacterized protein CANMA_004076 [Candida margitis]KAI5959976.1 hypothetical protein CANMA_004076 [Candida margitis]
MPLFAVPFSVKVALAVGGVAGAGLAIANNRTIILQAAENLFNRGAEYCHQKLEGHKIRNDGVYADNYEDGALAEDREEGRSTGYESFTELSTPYTTDFSEIDTDIEPADDEELELD